LLKNMRKFLFLLAAFVVVLLPASTTTAAPQSTITVNSLADDLDLNGNCTLREALRAAALNVAYDGCAAGAAGQPDLIVFSVNGTINLSLGAYYVSSAVIIQGNGRDQTIIDAGGSSGIFLFDRELSNSGSFSLRSLTLQNGRGVYADTTNTGPYLNLVIDDVVIQDSRCVTNNGAIDATTGSVTITNSLLQRNCQAINSWMAGITIEDSILKDNFGGAWSAVYIGIGEAVITNSLIEGNVSSGPGGGVYIGDGNLTLIDSTVRNNSTDEYGGGLVLEGSMGGDLLIQGSTISGNSAKRGGGIYFLSEAEAVITNSLIEGNVSSGPGGGVFIDESILTLIDSTVRNNSTDEYGGGLAVKGLYGDLLIRGSTISGNNAAQGNGGGIYFEGYYDQPSILITNSTISGNTALFGGGLYLLYQNSPYWAAINFTTFANNTATAILGAGGAIFLHPDSLPLTLTRSIISGNSGSPTCYPIGSLYSTGMSLLQDNSCGSHSTDVVAANPLLGSLANNGGNTQTHALLPNSPAIDLADCITGITVDQRGVLRPQGASCDSGAFEYGGALPAMYLPLALGRP
jgi:CSLREA domain-containing protein